MKNLALALALFCAVTLFTSCVNNSTPPSGPSLSTTIAGETEVAGTSTETIDYADYAWEYVPGQVEICLDCLLQDGIIVCHQSPRCPYSAPSEEVLRSAPIFGDLYELCKAPDWPPKEPYGPILDPILS